MSNVVKRMELYFKEGSSDKVYNVEIQKGTTGYEVLFAYGRRGNTLTTGTKTAGQVTYDKALAVFGKLVTEKMGKGYKELSNNSSSSVLKHTESDDMGVRPQLLNEVDEKELESLFTDPNWCAQEKYDGVRRLLIHQGNFTVGTNRRGISVTIPMEVEEAVNSALEGVIRQPVTTILDGEAIGDTVVIFDIVSEVSFKDRYNTLTKLKFDGKTLKLAPVAWTTKEKKDLFARLKKENAEGIVFKNINSKYTPGRPNSGGNQLKFKFVETATCIVTGGNLGKSSVTLAVFDKDGNQVPVGSATVYANQQFPSPGAIVEVKYLYYFPGGSLFQPVLLGEREDMSQEDCRLDQLKTKREEEIIL